MFQVLDRFKTSEKKFVSGCCCVVSFRHLVSVSYFFLFSLTKRKTRQEFVPKKFLQPCNVCAYGRSIPECGTFEVLSTRVGSWTWRQDSQYNDTELTATRHNGFIAALNERDLLLRVTPFLPLCWATLFSVIMTNAFMSYVQRPLALPKNVRQGWKGLARDNLLLIYASMLFVIDEEKKVLKHRLLKRRKLWIWILKKV